MQTDTDNLEYLNRRLTGWDQDLRWGHRGIEQLTMFLQEVQRHLDRQSQLQEQAQGHEEERAEGSDPDGLRFYSREDLQMAVDPMALAKLKQLATWYLLQVPALVEVINQCEAKLHLDDVAGLVKREAAREFRCGRC